MKQLTLGQFIDKLDQLSKFWYDTDDNAIPKSIAFDFGYFKPSSIHSYRGYYDQLAFGYNDEVTMSASEFLSMCNDAVGKTFSGYKGGEFKMGLDTPLWVANPRESCDTAVCDVTEHDTHIIIHTCYYD